MTTETLQFIQEHRNDDVRQLALQAAKYPTVDVPAALIQIDGRQRIRYKVPRWYDTAGILYPPHLSVEQCSSELTAQYKASLVKGQTLVDLTGGFGIDCAFLSGSFQYATYVERQAELCELARHNFTQLGLHIQVECADAVTYAQRIAPVDVVYIDPARRNVHGGKVVAVTDCEPDVARLAPVLLDKAKHVLIKLSPMLDIALALRSLPQTKSVHVVAVQNECKEVLLHLYQGTEPLRMYCVNYANNQPQLFEYSPDEEANAEPEYTDKVGAYLYEPNAAILKAGAFKSVAKRFGVRKLHPNSHLYTSDLPVEAFPGRSFSVESYASAKDKSLLADVKAANIAVRNYPQSVAELRRKLCLSDGGSVYIYGTTLADGRRILIRCKKLN